MYRSPTRRSLRRSELASESSSDGSKGQRHSPTTASLINAQQPSLDLDHHQIPYLQPTYDAGIFGHSYYGTFANHEDLLTQWHGSANSTRVPRTSSPAAVEQNTATQSLQTSNLDVAQQHFYNEPALITRPRLNFQTQVNPYRHLDPPLNSAAPFFPSLRSQQQSFGLTTSANSTPLTPTFPQSDRSHSIGTGQDLNSSNIILDAQDQLPTGAQDALDHNKAMILSSKRHLANKDGGSVPQMIYKPNKGYIENLESSLVPPVYLKSSEASTFGIRLGSGVPDIDDWDKPVPKGWGKYPSIRIKWPGYEEWKMQTAAVDCNGSPKSVGKFVEALLGNKGIRKFFDEALEETPDTDEFRLGNGPKDLKISDIFVVSLHHVSKGSLQPDFRVERRWH